MSPPACSQPAQPLLPASLLVLGLLATAGVRAQEAQPPAPESPPVEAPAAPAPAPAPVEPPPATPSARFEGALGLIPHLSPEYSGGAHYKLRVAPAIFLRYGRWTVSNSGAFATRRQDDVLQGLGTDLHRSDTVRTTMGLRIDRGRSSSSSAALNGLNDVRSTVRLRLGSSWTPDREHPLHPWRFSLAGTTDLLGRGGGATLEFAVSRDHRWSERIVWSNGVSLSAGSARYMQSRFGVSAAEAARTTYPEYTPGSGLLDAGVSTGWRMEINREWAALWGASAGRLLGPAARSPLTERPVHWDLRAGLAWRF